MKQPLIYQRFSGVNGYSDKWLLYFLNGQGSLFKALTSEIPDIYNRWIEKGQWERHEELKQWIFQANQYRKFYAEHFDEVEQHLLRKTDRWLFWMSVNIPSCIFRRTVLRFLRWKKRFGGDA